MLTLTRRYEEETVLVVPPSSKPQIIRHRQLERRGDGTRMGWILPAEVDVYRAEIYPADVAAGKVEA